MRRRRPFYTAILVTILTATTTASATCGAEETSNRIFERDNLLGMMLKANAYQKAHPIMKADDRNWVRGTWYSGVMEAYRATGDDRFLEQALAWGRQQAWQVGTEKCGANKLFCAETWLDLYFLKQDKAMIQPTIDWLATDQPNSPGSGKQQWYGDRNFTLNYADSLYGMPTLAKLYKATGDKKYLEIMNAFWDDLCGEIFDKDAGLFYRDCRFIGQKTAAGKKVFWSRGNGWVIGGLVRVLENLPSDDPARDKYLKMFKTLSAAIARCQGDDGLWRTNLADPQQFPGPETSGTGFFLYGIGWGVHNGLLDKPTYLPVLRKGWAGLANCLSHEGKVLYGQAVGDRPVEVSRDSSHEYVTGAFLLAAAQIYRLADEFVPETDCGYSPFFSTAHRYRCEAM